MNKADWKSDWRGGCSRLRDQLVAHVVAAGGERVGGGESSAGILSWSTMRHRGPGLLRVAPLLVTVAPMPGLPGYALKMERHAGSRAYGVCQVLPGAEAAVPGIVTRVVAKMIHALADADRRRPVGERRLEATEAHGLSDEAAITTPEQWRKAIVDAVNMFADWAWIEGWEVSSKSLDEDPGLLTGTLAMTTAPHPNAPEGASIHLTLTHPYGCGLSVAIEAEDAIGGLYSEERALSAGPGCSRNLLAEVLLDLMTTMTEGHGSEEWAWATRFGKEKK